MRANTWFRIAVLTGLLAGVSLAAPGLSDICSSAPAPGGDILVHTDVAVLDSDGIEWDTEGPPAELRVFYSTDSQSSWTEVVMTRLGTPGYDSTWQADFAVPLSGTVVYYVNAEHDGFMATQSPYNGGDTWPPGQNLIARVAVDDTGDAVEPEGPYLDLTGAYVGYSADHFYFVLTNNDDQWPTSGGLLKWFSYSLGFANPDAPSDTWVFAPVYVDAWPVMQYGLFAINRYSGEMPERVGDIDHHTAGNRLVMRCAITDMTSDPRFGPWPNQLGYVYAAAITQTITISGATAKDTTATGLFYAPRTPQLVVGENTTPVLSQARVVPRVGTPEDVFRFGLYYTDADTHLPVRRSLVVDEDTFELVPSSHRYWGRVLFSLNRSGFGLGLHWFHFSFDDGISTVTTTPDTFRVARASVAEGQGTSQARFSAGPAVFRDRVVLSKVNRGDVVEVRNSVGGVVRLIWAGSMSAVWDGRNNEGVEVPAGTYFIRTQSSPGSRLRVVKVR
ncbi:MAG: hypothetical protein JSU73_08155 [candidate division WOR-3 bacterium]|nr:MAG: hypothetical protein JSU73_08155 [candidate division WOR-3 bacterium]